MKEIAAELRRITLRASTLMLEMTAEEAVRPVLAGGWSAKQVVGHLIESAINNHQRFVRAALQGGIEWPGYDQDGGVRIQDFQSADWGMLVEVWRGLNQLLGHILEVLPAPAAGVPCRIGGQPAMTLRELAADYVRHLGHHLGQLGVSIG